MAPLPLRAPTLALLTLLAISGADGQAEPLTLLEQSHASSSDATYAITDGGRVVGVLRRQRLADTAPLEVEMMLGRRGGPFGGLLLPSASLFDDWLGADPLEEMWRRHTDLFSVLEQQLALALPWQPSIWSASAASRSLGVRQAVLARALAAGMLPRDIGWPAGSAGTEGSGSSPRQRMPMWVDAGTPWLPNDTDPAPWNWRLWEPQGGVNWGLLAFLALTSACLAVWAGIARQYCLYLSNKSQLARRWVLGPPLVPRPSDPNVLMPLLVESPSLRGGRHDGSLKYSPPKQPKVV